MSRPGRASNDTATTDPNSSSNESGSPEVPRRPSLFVRRMSNGMRPSGPRRRQQPSDGLVPSRSNSYSSQHSSGDADHRAPNSSNINSNIHRSNTSGPRRMRRSSGESTGGNPSQRRSGGSQSSPKNNHHNNSNRKQAFRRKSDGSTGSGGGNSIGSSGKRRKKKSRSKSQLAAAAYQQQLELNQRLASLQLPHMPASVVSQRPSPEAFVSAYKSTNGVGSSNHNFNSSFGSISSTSNHNNPQKTRRATKFQPPQDPPILRILVVADIDLESASALAESALTSSSRPLDASSNNKHDEEENPLQRVDLCIACGPFCQEEDMRNYYQGRQRRRHMTRHGAGYCATQQSAAPIWSKRGGSGNTNALLPLPPMPQQPPPASSSNQQRYHSPRSATTLQRSPASFYGGPHQRTGPSHNLLPQSLPAQQQQPQQAPMYPLKRTREETAAMEGLMTAALSQLESIVCRVVFVPGKTDPLTTITSSSSSLAYTKERRLTPNSRNIHQNWMPLSPGLGCAGLSFLDGQRLLQQQTPPLEDGDDEDDDDEEEEEDDDDDDDEFDPQASDNSSMLPDPSRFARLRKSGSIGARISLTGEIKPVHAVPFDDEEYEEVDDGPPTHDERAKEYGTLFCKHLQDLVELAPEKEAITDSPTPHSQITELMQTKRFQSILVTHFHHLEKDVQAEEHSSGSANHFDNGTFGGSGGPVDGPGFMTRAAYPSNAVSSKSLGDNSFYLPGAGMEEEEDEEEEDEESFDPPWPTEHEAFCALPVVQEHVLLEIAAGRNSKGHTVQPMELPKGPTMRVVMPGSLRERGEFCLVDVAFTKSPPSSHGSANKATADDYRWRVHRTRFQTIGDYI